MGNRTHTVFVLAAYQSWKPQRIRVKVIGGASVAVLSLNKQDCFLSDVARRGEKPWGLGQSVPLSGCRAPPPIGVGDEAQGRERLRSTCLPGALFQQQHLACYSKIGSS
jgi:hypothetical protein